MNKSRTIRTTDDKSPTGLKVRQQQLMDFLLSGNPDIQQHIAQQGKTSTQSRLGIYRNAYSSRLRDVIDIDHPITGTYLGDELFELMVNQYIQQHPSNGTSLRHFANNLPDFLGQHPPFNDNLQISELARFERILLSSFDAADANRISLPQLSSLPADAWPTMTINFHPSVQLFNTHGNVVAIWQAITQQTNPPAPEQCNESWLVWRNSEMLTEFQNMDNIALWMFHQIKAGADFATICESLLEIVAEGAVSAAAVDVLTRWINMGAISNIGTDTAVVRST